MASRHYWYDIKIYPFEGGISIYFHVITERKKKEEELLQSKEKFRSLAETSPDWIWETDMRGVYTYASPQSKDISGSKPKEIIGKVIFDFMPKDEAERIKDIFISLAKNRETIKKLENINIHKNGNLVVIETNELPLLDKR